MARRRERVLPVEVEGSNVWVDEAALPDAPEPRGRRLGLADYRAGLERALHDLAEAERELAELPAGLPAGDIRRRRFALRLKTARGWVALFRSKVDRMAGRARR